MKIWFDEIKSKIPDNLDSFETDKLIKKHLRGRVKIGDMDTSNLITTAGRRAVISALSNPQISQNKNIIPRFKILKFGASTSFEQPSESDTELGGTTVKRVVEQVDPVSDKLVITNFVGTPEMNFTWGKVGLFLADGTLFSVASVSEPKTNEVSKTVCWEITWE